MLTLTEIINRPTAVCDVLLINCYPYWEGVDIKIAGFYLQEMYSKTLGLANGKKLLYPKQVGQVKEKQYNLQFPQVIT
jgi:hypothetical protein